MITINRSFKKRTQFHCNK